MPAPKGNDFAVGNSGGGAPEGNQNAVGNDGGAPKGNANAMTHGRHMDPEDLRETFSEAEEATYAALLRGHQERVPEYSEERAEQLATIQMAHTRLTRELLDSLSGGGESFPTRGFEALRAYGRDLRETEAIAREEARKHRMDLLTGRGEVSSEEDMTPDRSSAPEEPVEPETPDTPVSATSAVERVMADGSGEPPEEHVTSTDEVDEGEDETDEDATTRLSRRVSYADLNRGRGR